MTEVYQRLPKISATIEIIGKGINHHYVYEGDIPEELMDAYKEVVGDGLAGVTVSADMAIKDYGTGASAMVSISLTCGQDQETITRAVSLAGNLARKFASEQRLQAEQELQKLVNGTTSSGSINYGR